jgi:hypothetical protein
VAKIDLATATLDFPYLRWRKHRGVPGKLYMFVTSEADGTTTIEDLRLDAADLTLRARIVPAADFKGVRLVEIRDLKFADNEMRGRVRFAEDGGVDVELVGARIDIGPLLDSENEVDAAATTNGIPIRIKARFNEVLFGEGRSLNDVNAVLRRDGENWRHIAIDTGVGGEVRLAVSFNPVGDGATLSISTIDAGKALQAADWTRRLKGGKLLVTGGQSQPGGPIIGKFQLKKFKVTEAPALARVLQVLSLTGIFSVLNQDGLEFVTLDGDFRYYGGALEIKNTRAFGSSIGITAEGAVYVEDETADLSGTVVPAYTINRVLGSIPILGTLLTGGKNEGLFAADYELSGRLENPRISVNPLSALAPGFFRKLIGKDVKPLTGEDASLDSQ